MFNVLIAWNFTENLKTNDGTWNAHLTVNAPFLTVS
jgi:hypothetical protein